MGRGDAEEGGQNQQQPLLPFSVSFASFLRWSRGDSLHRNQRATWLKRGGSIKTHMYVSQRHGNANRGHTHLFMSVLVVQSAPEHANDFHYANACKSDPTI